MKLNAGYVRNILYQQNIVQNVEKLVNPHMLCRENGINKDRCLLTGKFRGLGHNICNSNARKAHSFFVPRLFQNFSSYLSHLFLKKSVNMAIEKDKRMKGEDIRAKSSKNYISVRKDVLYFWILENFWSMVKIMYQQQNFFHL